MIKLIATISPHAHSQQCYFSEGLIRFYLYFVFSQTLQFGARWWGPVNCLLVPESSIPHHESPTSLCLLSINRTSFSLLSPSLVSRDAGLSIKQYNTDVVCGILVCIFRLIFLIYFIAETWKSMNRTFESWKFLLLIIENKNNLTYEL